MTLTLSTHDKLMGLTIVLGLIEIGVQFLTVLT